MQQGALPAPARLKMAAGTKRDAKAAGATPLGPKQKHACRAPVASSSRAGEALPEAADRQLATAAAVTGRAAAALSGAGIAGRAAGLSEARSDVGSLRETAYAGVKTPTTAEQTKLIANATFNSEEEHAERMLFKQARSQCTACAARDLACGGRWVGWARSASQDLKCEFGLQQVCWSESSWAAPEHP